MRFRPAGFGAGVLLAAAAVGAADWPRFRGPNGTGVSDDPNIPTTFSNTENVLWKVTIPGGAGYGSPIVSAGKIFLQADSADGKERSLLCLDAADGKTLWKQTAPGTPARIHNKNSRASSTPATDGKSVFVVFWDGQDVHAAAYDYAGKKLWTRDLGGFASQHGAGESPIVFGGKVYLNHDQDGSAKLVALEAATGAISWEQTRPAYRASYSTPFILEREGKAPELIVASTAGIAGHDPASGKQNWVWNWDWGGGNDDGPARKKKGGPGGALRTVGSPVAADGLILISAGDGKGDRAIAAVKSDGAGDVSGKAKVWSDSKNALPYVPTMLAKGGHIYYVGDTGFATCLSAATGKVVWTERLGAKFSASPVLINGQVYAASEDGDVFVFPAKGEYTLTAKNTLGEVIEATPAVADGKLFIRTRGSLYCIGKK